MARSKRRTKDSQRKALTWVGVIIVAAAAVTAGAVVGLCKLWRGVTHMDEFMVQPDVTLSEPWINEVELKKDFLRTDPAGALSRKCSIFRSGLANEVASAYAHSPWVRRVKEVRKVFPNRLDVRLELREPFAVAVFGNKHCCLDRDGVVLSPRVYRLMPEVLASLKPVIVLPGDVPAPVAGQRWEDASVLGGLSMVRLCREQFADVGVRCVELRAATDSAGRRFAVAALVLEDGPRVQWGRVPVGPASPAEVSTPQKAAALRAVVVKEGENLGRLRTINVRWYPTVVNDR